MATPINPLPNLTQYNFDIGDIEEVVTKQNGVNAVLEQLGPQINATVDSINTDVANVNDAAANLNVEEIVHAPGSGLNNEAGDAYSRDVVGGSGSLMAHGAYGLGGGAISLIDFNSPNNESYFYAGAGGSSTNMPTPLAAFWPGVIAYRSVSNRTAMLSLSSDGMTLRTKEGSTINPDQKMYSNRNIIGSVSQSSGFPAGAVIERGSNSDGDYTKFADGTLICRLPSSLGRTIDINIQVSGDIYRSGTGISWTYPFPFTSEPICQSGIRFGVDVVGNAKTPNNTSCIIGAISFSGSKTGQSYSAIAIGYWY